MKKLAILFIISGIMAIIQGDHFAHIIIGLLCIGIGVWLYKRKPIKTTKKKSTRKKKNTYTFRVAGVTKDGRQSIIKKMVKDWKEFNEDDIYDGLKNSEIEDYGKVYEVDIENWGKIDLIPEPDNEYDPNAIKVVHEEFGMLGYVPADETEKVKEIIKNDYKLNWKIVGGNYKYYDDYEDKLKIETLTYGIEIRLIFEEASD